MKVHLETFGCQMNRLDSELVAGLLRRSGHEIVDDGPAAELVLYNTCSVRLHAEEKVHSRLGLEDRRTLSGNGRLVGVLGCMAQREGEALRRRHSSVAMVCGPGRLHELPALIADAAAGRASVLLDAPREDGAATGADDVEALDRDRDVRCTRSPAQAYVRVMRGCDNFCTYCVVPFVRGAERSRAPEAIEQEVRRLAEAGRSEITLLGQAVNRYEWRAGERTVRFSDLLGRLSPIAGLRRLRFVTSHPERFGDDLLEAMRDLPNVCEYIHAPPQSGSDRILRAMGRRYTRAEYDRLVDRAREIVPGVVLAGDFIVGFPGETEEDHAASGDLIRRSGFKNSFIFKYSPRPGTAAAEKLPDDVPMEVKRRRNRELLAVQAEVSQVHHKAYVGRTVEVLIEGPSPRADRQPRPAQPGQTQLVGRTRWDHIVVFDGPESLAGRYVDVRVTGATSLTLLGEHAGGGS